MDMASPSAAPDARNSGTVHSGGETSDAAGRAAVPAVGTVDAASEHQQQTKTGPHTWTCPNCCHQQALVGSASAAAEDADSRRRCKFCAPTPSESSTRAPIDLARLAIAYDERMLAIEGAPPAPYERPERISHAWQMLNSRGLLEDALKIQGREAREDEILQVHSRDLPHADQPNSNPEGPKHSHDVCTSTRVSCGCAIDAVTAVADRTATAAVALVRPPGHRIGRNIQSSNHATLADSNAGGPATAPAYNNVAVAVRAAQKRDGVDKIMVVDWGVRHGCGTQAIFYDDPSVLTLSVHRAEISEEEAPEASAPEKSGEPTEIGSAAGLGFNVNVTWSKTDTDTTVGSITDADYIYVWNRIVLPLAYEFCPDMVVVAAGFDAGVADPIGSSLHSPCSVAVTPQCFGHLTAMLNIVAGGRVALVLEGGYNLCTASESLAACINALRGLASPMQRCMKPSAKAVADVQRTVDALSGHWDSFPEVTPALAGLSTCTGGVLPNQRCTRNKDCVKMARHRGKCKIVPGSSSRAVGDLTHAPAKRKHEGESRWCEDCGKVSKNCKCTTTASPFVSLVLSFPE
eukprot:SAG31_NODE_2391_length_5799_cov_3.680526_2_plen_575_part_00